MLVLINIVKIGLYCRQWQKRGYVLENFQFDSRTRTLLNQFIQIADFLISGDCPLIDTEKKFIFFLPTMGRSSCMLELVYFSPDLGRRTDSQTHIHAHIHTHTHTRLSILWLKCAQDAVPYLKWQFVTSCFSHVLWLWKSQMRAHVVRTFKGCNPVKFQVIVSISFWVVALGMRPYEVA
jgi:hypothetical protein